MISALAEVALRELVLLGPGLECAAVLTDGEQLIDGHGLDGRSHRAKDAAVEQRHLVG